MNLRGTLVEVGAVRRVETQNGMTDLAEVRIRPKGSGGEPVTLTLWGDWAATVDLVDAGAELLATDVQDREFRGETQYATSGQSFVVVEPGFLATVTAVRQWVQCPRIYYLNGLNPGGLAYPMVRGTIVHALFGDLLMGADRDQAIQERVAEAAVEIGLLDRDPEAVTAEVTQHARAIEDWLAQGRLSRDGWRSEQTLISDQFGLRGRADAVRRGVPVELKTGKNLRREPRFPDKVQVACYGLLLAEDPLDTPDTGTLLYTKNATLDDAEESGDLSPAKDFSIGRGLVEYVVRSRNELAAMAIDGTAPTGHEADKTCAYCFERDTCMAVAGRLDQESKAGSLGEPVPADERKYFDKFYRALTAERRAIHAEFAKLWEQSPAERAAEDRALVDLVPEGTRKRDDGRWEVSAGRPGEAVSKIREGDLVLASEGDPLGNTAELARVEQLGERVVVSTTEPLDLRRLDVYPSELSVDRQLQALHDGILRGDQDQKDVYFGRRSPAFGDTRHTYVENNPGQNQAVNTAVNAEDLALVHGPPGTGKTRTLARAVRALVDRGDRVLVAAFTNRAVDNAIQALREQGVSDIVRQGSEVGIAPSSMDLRLDQSGSPDEMVERLQEAGVVAATTATCGSRPMRELSFDVAVVDEAGQLTEPATLPPATLAERVVLVGDHHQLPPVVQSGDSALQVSLFERLIERHPDAAVRLEAQYRMAQRIQSFAAREFYDGQLRPATADVAGQTLDNLTGVDATALPPHLQEQVVHLDPAGTQEGHRNVAEAGAVCETVEAYLDAGLAPDMLGVIAPFRAQVAEITGRISDGVTVDTVDRFQGSSREVIVVSFVATGSLDGPIFEDRRRVNVALTRARRALVLVGDRSALASQPFYKRLLQWAR